MCISITYISNKMIFNHKKQHMFLCSKLPWCSHGEIGHGVMNGHTLFLHHGCWDEELKDCLMSCCVGLAGIWSPKAYNFNFNLFQFFMVENIKTKTLNKYIKICNWIQYLNSLASSFFQPLLASTNHLVSTFSRCSHSSTVSNSTVTVPETFLWKSSNAYLTVSPLLKTNLMRLGCQSKNWLTFSLAELVLLPMAHEGSILKALFLQLLYPPIQCYWQKSAVLTKSQWHLQRVWKKTQTYPSLF